MQLYIPLTTADKHYHSNPEFSGGIPHCRPGLCSGFIWLDSRHCLSRPFFFHQVSVPLPSPFPTSLFPTNVSLPLPSPLPTSLFHYPPPPHVSPPHVALPLPSPSPRLSSLPMSLFLSSLSTSLILPLRHYSSLLSLLHAGEPCTSCGLRFISRTGEEYRNHLDWHFRMNRKEREGFRKSSRNWFMHPEVRVLEVCISLLSLTEYPILVV